MKNIDNILLKPHSTIKEALSVIESGSKKIALVVDDDKKLLGTLTDGDIRRALLKNLSLDDFVESIIFKTPITCKANYNREEILELSLKNKLYQIPIVDESGKLIDIIEVNDLLKPKNKPNYVVLMAGGFGTRLRPLTENTPKPMLHVGNKPILETIIGNFKKYGFTNIIISVSYKAKVIEDYFKDGKEFGVNIEYIHENKRMGTAGALSLMRDKLEGTFFVMNGDLLTNVNFENMLEYHINNASSATMGVREYDFQVPYGVVDIKDKKIVGITEKPVHSFYVSAGIYVLEPEVLELIPDDKFYDMPTLFEEMIEKKMQSYSFPISEYWLDIGQIDEFKKANSDYNEVF
ncbi:MAG: alcohol dehydrogenase [Sulfurimonas sp. RIFOXYD12_FULL_33_39]|uniref:nucleotidyltransferase family protein n=1 Tax=unclassified Sulfurimonas TaxID=2623549 RepID=UPI0008BC177A|nr:MULTISPECIES: nucleotidyltransferase family protein [unclassified Sulfurimonas]OHE10289.1 MAG: alcohol dehydrogenase [Sulfurimonas sp. RIFOXYD12_FULL_33_39]OHE13134.1 MAG: alcohol dehydrogenase [Sulfurimonas sp. RIFOXYD2_FULL_34_21]DAB27734.1 MAG TPA: alcohol dehydrogenase [Sulfurimonas sp. UBA10385]